MPSALATQHASWQALLWRYVALFPLLEERVRVRGVEREL